MDKLVELPLLILRKSVLFPYASLSVVITRESSIQAIQAASKTEEKLIAVISGRVKTANSELVGTVANIKRLRHRKEKLEVVLNGIERVSLPEESSRSLAMAEVSPYPVAIDLDFNTPLVAAVIDQIIHLQTILRLREKGISSSVKSIDTLIVQTFTLAPKLHAMIGELENLLHAPTAGALFERAQQLFTQEINLLRLRQKISKQTSAAIQRDEREQWLRHQLASIEKELGELSPQRADINLLKDKLARLQVPDAVRKDLERQLVVLEKLSVYAPEYHIIRAHLEFVSELPWQTEAEDKFELPIVRQALDKEHYGQDDIKERLMEHFAVLHRQPRSRVSPLCFVGPPGVGKNSFAESIARAINRPYERINLSILNDEVDLGGQRKTHLDASPGRILQAVKKSGVKNPLLIFDEIDKIGEDSTAAGCLLETFDPSLNKGFVDNYLNYPFDLSEVFIIAIANRVDTIPDPLYDQMEIFFFNGYTEQEKITIARQHLLKYQLQTVGMTADEFEITDSAFLQLIRDYTREAGVRRLSRLIGRLVRKAAKDVITDGKQKVSIGVDDVKEVFSKLRYHREPRREVLVPGVATGLAWTEAGGEILYIETVKFPATRELILTGHLGKVMRESAETALSWVISKASNFGLTSEKLTEFAVHVHVPAGAIPKDGPSAGLAMVAALTSLFTNVAVDSRFAMTGEITLGGNVLPVGGIKEKLLAAHRDQFLHVILPKENERDLEELPLSVRNTMHFYFVSTAENALKLALPSVFERLLKKDEEKRAEASPESPSDKPTVPVELSH